MFHRNELPELFRQLADIQLVQHQHPSPDICHTVVDLEVLQHRWRYPQLQLLQLPEALSHSLQRVVVDLQLL